MAPVATNTGGSATDSIPLWSQNECAWTTTSGTISMFDSNQDLEQAGSQSAFGAAITNGVTAGSSKTYPTCSGGVGVSASGGLGDAWTVNTANPLPTPIDTNTSAAQGDLPSSNLDLTSASSGSVGGCWGSVNILASTSTTSFGSGSTAAMTLPSPWVNGGDCKYGSLGSNSAGGNTDTSSPTGDANCPPSQADVNAGLVSCGTIVSSGNDENGTTNYSSLDLFYSGQPVPQTPTAALSTSTAVAGTTITVTGGSDWWGSAGGAPNAGPYGDFQNSAYEFYPVSAPSVYIGTSRATAVAVTNSTVTISSIKYTCTGAESTTVGPNPCTLSVGAPSGTFQIPSGLAAGAYNIYVDESNTTPLPGNGPNDAYQTARGTSRGTAESSTPITIKDSSTDTDSPTASSIVIGSSDTDTATITGSSTPDPTGSVTFYECGPTSSPGPCTSSSWTSIGSASLGGTKNPGTVASSSFKPSTTGEWCFTSVYPGDSNYVLSSDTTADGCFNVTDASSSVTNSPATSSFTLGGSDSDSATVTGSVSGIDPTGSVTFYRCGPTSSPAPCTSSSWTSIGSKSLGGTTNPGTATSATFSPASTGYWCFASVYSGDSNYVSSSDTTTDGCFHVTAASSSITNSPATASITLGGSESDSATVTGSVSGTDPTGSVTFYECGPTSSPAPCTSGSWTSIGNASLGGTTNPDMVASSSFKPGSAGYWCFASVYSGDPNYLTSSDSTTDGCFDVAKVLYSTSITNAPTSSSIVLGTSNTDSAKVSGSSTPDPTGSVSFYECGPDSSAAPCSSGSWTLIGTGALNGTSNPATVSSNSFKPTSTGYWCFTSTYPGDTNYLSSSDTTTDGCFDVTVASSSITNAPASAAVTLGSSNSDSAIVTGSLSADPTGSVTFYECGPVGSPSPCSSSSWTQYDIESLSGNANPVNVPSESFKADSTGYWCFTSVYSGDSNYLSAYDTTDDGCFDVTVASSSITNKPASASITLGGSDSDSATITGSLSGTDPTGSVTFYECGSVSSPAPCTSSTWTEIGTQSLGGTTNPGTVTSTSFKPASAGYWCFTSVYSGDSDYQSSTDTTDDGCFDVAKVPAPTMTSFSPASVAVGATVTIKGTNLAGAKKVTIGSKVATIVAGSDKSTQLKIKVPTGAKTGKIKVTTAGGTATSKTSLKVT